MSSVLGLQVKDEAGCGVEAAGHRCGLQWPQLHAPTGVGVCGEEPALTAGD